MRSGLLLFVALALTGIATGCKPAPRPVYQGEGRLVAEGPARDVIAAPDGKTVAWLGSPNLAREKGINASDMVYVGSARMAPASGGQPVTLGDGVATLPGTFFFSPTGKHLGALIGWSFPKAMGSLVVADTASGKLRKVADQVSFFGFSADGETVGYVAERTLYVQPVGGGDAREIVGNAGTFEFAPSGNVLVARRRSVGGGGELIRVDLADPAAQPRVLAQRVSDYIFSPDGSRLAWTARNEDGGADLFVSEGSAAPRRVGTGVPTFRFSPDGKQLAFLGDVTPQKQFGDLYLLNDGSQKARKVGTTVTEFLFSPNSRRIAWLDRYHAPSRGGYLTWIDVAAEGEKGKEVAWNVPSFIWNHGSDALAFIRRIAEPHFSIDLFLARVEEEAAPIRVGQGVFGYSFTKDDQRLLFRTACTRNARSCELHSIDVSKPMEPARHVASGIFTYELDPNDESTAMITYARTDADALDIAAVPTDGSAAPKTLDRMVARGTKFIPGSDRMVWAVLDPNRMGVYVGDPPEFAGE